MNAELNFNGDDLKSIFESKNFKVSFLADFLTFADMNSKDLILTGH